MIFRGKRSIILVLMLCLAMLTTSIAYAKSNDGLKNGQLKKGYYEAVADAKQLEILNRLYGTEISYGELVQAVYPEALEYIPEETLQKMHKTPVDWIGEETSPIPKTNGRAGSKRPSDVEASAVISVGHESNISASASVINYDSGSRVWTPHPWYRIPSMSVISNLQRENVGIVHSVFRTGNNVYEISASGSYWYPPKGNYRTVGQHWGTFPAGYDPPTYSSVSATTWRGVN